MGRVDHQRFESLLRKHQRIVYKVASVYAKHAEDRRDLEQEIVTQVWRSFPRFDETKATFSTWLYRVALNVAISQLRHRRKGNGEPWESLQPHHLETIAGNAPSVELDERLVTLYAYIGQLDALNRALILLYLEDRSYAEIAEILGISQTNVATKISRIKQTLRDQMVDDTNTGA